MVVANNLQCDASIELKVLHSDKANVYVHKEVYKENMWPLSSDNQFVQKLVHNVPISVLVFFPIEKTL